MCFVAPHAPAAFSQRARTTTMRPDYRDDVDGAKRKWCQCGLSDSPSPKLIVTVLGRACAVKILFGAVGVARNLCESNPPRRPTRQKEDVRESPSRPRLYLLTFNQSNPKYGPTILGCRHHPRTRKEILSTRPSRARRGFSRPLGAAPSDTPRLTPRPPQRLAPCLPVHCAPEC